MFLTEEFKLDNCNNPVEYEILHSEVPLKLSEPLRDAIFYLLWYVPNISSVQSGDNELISNSFYDDYTFIEIMRYMKLKDEDVLITEKISEKIENSFRNRICLDSQKLILTKSEYETKTECLLRHIRNSIAHGYFNVVDDLVIGFDSKLIEGGIEEVTAIFKIDPTNLLRALKRISDSLNSKEVVLEALKKCGYFVEEYEVKYQKSYLFDFYAKKDERRYAITIEYVDTEEVSHARVLELIETFEGKINNRVKPLLIINTSLLSEESKEELLKHDIILLDVKNIQKMLNGRDMIFEIELASEYNIEHNLNR